MSLWDALFGGGGGQPLMDEPQSAPPTSPLAQLLMGSAPSPEATMKRNRAFLRPDTSGPFVTQLAPDEEAAFRQWVKQNNVPFNPEAPGPQDYDMRGFWRGLQSGDPRAHTGKNPNDQRLHFSDAWKTPYHQSFSAESQWADPLTAPRWNARDQLVAPDGRVVLDEPAETARADNARNLAALASGDPEAAGAVAASQAMEPVTGPYLRDVATGQYAAQGLQNVNDTFARARSGDRNALIEIAGMFGPGAIRAYHGSPHDFAKFDISKIGTGEGAQAYGHGLYFAENPATAEVYRDQVKNMALIDANNKRMAEIARQMEPLKRPGTYREFTDPRGYKLAEEYDRLMAEKLAPGRMYEVDLHADPQRFLDWDKPLSEQSAAVREPILTHPNVARSIEAQASILGDKARDPTGQSAYAMAAGWHRGVDLSPPREGAATASSYLNEAGIPGIRYFDQGSRSASQGTSNYAVFNPDIIEILRKYGIAGLLGGSGAAGAMSSDVGR